MFQAALNKTKGREIDAMSPEAFSSMAISYKLCGVGGSLFEVGVASGVAREEDVE